MRKFINRIVALFLSLCMAMQLGAGDVFFVFAQSLDDPVIESGTQPVSEEPTVPEEPTDQVETEPPKQEASFLSKRQKLVVLSLIYFGSSAG